MYCIAPIKNSTRHATSRHGMDSLLARDDEVAERVPQVALDAHRVALALLLELHVRSDRSHGRAPKLLSPNSHPEQQHR